MPAGIGAADVSIEVSRNHPKFRGSSLFAMWDEEAFRVGVHFYFQLRLLASIVLCVEGASFHY